MALPHGLPWYSVRLQQGHGLPWYSVRSNSPLNQVKVSGDMYQRERESVSLTLPSLFSHPGVMVVIAQHPGHNPLLSGGLDSVAAGGQISRTHILPDTTVFVCS